MVLKGRAGAIDELAVDEQAIGRLEVVTTAPDSGAGAYSNFVIAGLRQ
jgi:hypothetical protein